MRLLAFLGLTASIPLGLLAESSVVVRAVQPQLERTTARFTWTGPGGAPLPFNDEEEILNFLRTADVGELEGIGVGITGVRRGTLEKGGVRIRAVFRTVDVRPDKFDRSSGKVRDYHLYECAAYELSRMLGLDIVPPTVMRNIGREKGTLQAWVENAMMEKDRLSRGLKPPDMRAWNLQESTMGVFDNLIFNDDRHLGNILIDPNWKIWLIDHTRAFRTFIHLRDRQKIVHCERGLWDSLRNLNEQALKQRLSPFLTKEEIRTIEKRRRALIEYVQRLIEKRGEQDVILDSS